MQHSIYKPVDVLPATPDAATAASAASAASAATAAVGDEMAGGECPGGYVGHGGGGVCAVVFGAAAASPSPAGSWYCSCLGITLIVL